MPGFIILYSRKIYIVRHLIFNKKTIKHTSIFGQFFDSLRSFVVFAPYFALQCVFAVLDDYVYVFAFYFNLRDSVGFCASGYFLNFGDLRRLNLVINRGGYMK